MNKPVQLILERRLEHSVNDSEISHSNSKESDGVSESYRKVEELKESAI